MTPYQRGYQDAHIGSKLEDNPFDPYAQLAAYEAWIEGWQDAQ